MNFDAVVCGAGVVGLAVARSLSGRGLSVLIVEKNASIGAETSSRNSEVIHAGIYYPENSEKYRHCISGKAKLKRYLSDKNIDILPCGKFVVATSLEEEHKLAAMFERLKGLGVDDISLLSLEKAAKMEPDLKCNAVMYSSGTAVFDSHTYMSALAADLESSGGILVTRHQVIDVVESGDRYKIIISNQESDPVFTKRVINATGLWACDFMSRFDLGDGQNCYDYAFAKGSYFTLSGKSPFRRLIYPIPEAGGLGIHSTLDLSNMTRFGPNVEWLDCGVSDVESKYPVADDLRDDYVTAISKYWPQISRNRLVPGYSGIRPKLIVNGDQFPDFRLVVARGGGERKCINLLGIESPGLTASLSLAESVTRLVE